MNEGDRVLLGRLPSGGLLAWPMGGAIAEGERVLLGRTASGHLVVWPLGGAIPSETRVVLGRTASGVYAAWSLAAAPAGDVTLLYDSGGFFGLGGTAGIYWVRRAAGAWGSHSLLSSAAPDWASVARTSANEGSGLSEPSTIINPASLSGFLWGQFFGNPLIFRLSDGNVLAIFYDDRQVSGTLTTAYALRVSGTWGSAVAFSATQYYWSACCRDGDDIYGILHQHTTGDVLPFSLIYNAGSPSFSVGSAVPQTTAPNNQSWAAYFEDGAARFHAVYWDNVGSGNRNVKIVAINTDLSVAYSANLRANVNTGAQLDQSPLSISGDGGATFFVYEHRSDGTAHAWKIVAGASSYTITDESANLATPSGTSPSVDILVSIWTGVEILLVASIIPSSGQPTLQSCVRVDDSSYSAWEVIATSTTGFRFVDKFMGLGASGANTRVMYFTQVGAARALVDDVIA